MGFMVYDLILLGLFIIAIALFLYKRKKNVTRQSVIFLYKTDWGIRLMDSFSKKNRKWLMPLRYLAIICGYVLMVVIVWFIVEVTYIYLKFPIAKYVKAPPLAPIIPYFPELFGLSSMFPPLYFTYFIIAVGIGGILHEFSHGIFARLHNWKVKSTGFLFLGPLLGAFVEPDEKQIAKGKKVQQLSMLAGGTFSNGVVAFISAGLLWIFFLWTISAAGVGFNDYASVVVNTSEIKIPYELDLNATFVEVQVENETFFANPEILKQSIEGNITRVLLFEDAPAIRNNLSGAIMEFNGVKTTNYEELVNAIDSHSSGEKVKIKTAVRDGVFDVNPEFREVELELGERNGEAFLGIGITPLTALGFKGTQMISYLFMTGAGTLNPLIYYENSLGDFGWFIYFLLWWVFLINVLLALFNMLPVGPLDGGRFLQLTIEGLTKNKNAGRKVFSSVSWFILILFALMMIKWGFSFF